MKFHEMLKLAAKAAGLEVVFSGDECFLAELHGNPSFRFRKRWNPRDDDGDAFRLAVKIERDAKADFWSRVIALRCVFDFMDDPCASTRLAIVRAAAEIGSAMQPPKGEERTQP